MGDMHTDQVPVSTEENASKVNSAVSPTAGARYGKAVVADGLHDFIDNAAASVLLDTPKSSRILLWGVVCFVITAIVWAYFAELDEITRGEGSVIPSQQIQVVQYLEGGILKELYVKEGDKVETGQPLLRVDETRFLSDFRGKAQEQAYLEISIARHRAELASIVISDEAVKRAWRGCLLQKASATPMSVIRLRTY